MGECVHSRLPYGVDDAFDHNEVWINISCPQLYLFDILK